MRPHQFYKHIFHQCVAELGATSILDVGCGSGEWVADLRANGIEAHGIETSSSITLSNPFLVHGSAENLPFPDKSVDVVTSEFAAHHFIDLQRHLKEAARVARYGIAILDPWYDDSIASQCNARALDVWFKTIDRASGEIHNDVISSADFLAAMPTEQIYSVRFQTLLKLEPVPDEKQSDWFENYTKKCKRNPERISELSEIRTSISKNGLTQDGAIIFIAEFDERQSRIFGKVKKKY